MLDIYSQLGQNINLEPDKKRNLYVAGIKFMNYHATQPNFRGRFYQQKAIDDSAYEQKKLDHLKMIDEGLSKDTKVKLKDKQIFRGILELKRLGLKRIDITRAMGISEKTYSKALTFNNLPEEEKLIKRASVPLT